MSFEPIQDTNPDGYPEVIGFKPIKKPKNINLLNFEEYNQWKNITIFHYSSKREIFPFIQIRNNVLYSYNYGDYKWIIVYNDLVKFFNYFDMNNKGEKRSFKQTYDNFAYHLNKIKEDGHDHYIEDRNQIESTKIFRTRKDADPRIVLIPYTTFWALLESYNPQIAKDILKKLHEVDYERMISDAKQQTLIEQIQGEKALSQILFEELHKCETLIQKGLVAHLFEIYPQLRVEKRFFDEKNGWYWKMDLIIGNLVLELDGNQHRFNDERFSLDEKKDTFNFENGRYTFRRSNPWWQRNYREFREMVINFIENHKDLL